MKFNTLAFAALLLGACGIPDSTLLVDIDSAKWEKVCAHVAEAKTENVVDCDGVEVTTQVEMTEAEHEAACNEAWGDTSTWEGCTATFGDWVEFNEFEPADYCVYPYENTPAGYDAIVACMM